MTNKTLVVSAALSAFVAVGAQAAPLDLPTDPDTLLTMDATDLVVLDLTTPGVAPFFAFMPAFGTGFSGVIAGGPVAGLLVNVADSGAGFPEDVTLAVTDPVTFDDVLTGTLTNTDVAIDPTGPDRLGLLFTPTSGSAAEEFELGALLTLFGEFGDDPLNDGIGDFFNPVPVEATLTAVVPLPMSGLMLGGALVGVAALRRRA